MKINLKKIVDIVLLLFYSFIIISYIYILLKPSEYSFFKNIKNSDYGTPLDIIDSINGKECLFSFHNNKDFNKDYCGNIKYGKIGFNIIGKIIEQYKKDNILSNKEITKISFLLDNKNNGNIVASYSSSNNLFIFHLNGIQDINNLQNNIHHEFGHYIMARENLNNKYHRICGDLNNKCKYFVSKYASTINQEDFAENWMFINTHQINNNTLLYMNNGKYYQLGNILKINKKKLILFNKRIDFIQKQIKIIKKKHLDNVNSFTKVKPLKYSLKELHYLKRDSFLYLLIWKINNIF